EIDFSLRDFGHCHFAHLGNLVHAERWYQTLLGYLRQSRELPRGPLALMTVDRADVRPGTRVNVSWRTARVRSCRLSYQDLDSSSEVAVDPSLALHGSIAVNPDKSVTYHLRCVTPSGRRLRNWTTITVWSGPIRTYEGVELAPIPSPPRGPVKTMCDDFICIAGASWVTPGADVPITWTIADPTVKCRLRGPFSGRMLVSIVQGSNNGGTSGPITEPTRW